MFLKLKQQTNTTSKNVETVSNKSQKETKVITSTIKDKLSENVFSSSESITFEKSNNISNSQEIITSNFSLEQVNPNVETVINVNSQRSTVHVESGIPGLDEIGESSQDSDVNIFNIVAEEQAPLSSFLANNSNNEQEIFIWQDALNRFPAMFSPSDVSDLLQTSRKLKNIEIPILSHEIVKIKKFNKSNSIGSNLLFTSENHLRDDAYLKIKNSEISKCESISDRMINYIDVRQHTSLVEKNIEKSKKIISSLDETSSFTNKHEKEINYGNIVEKFILEGSGKYNGKISNYIFENNDNDIQNLYITYSGGKDERFLDKQDKNYNSIFNKNDLKLFFNNITGFDFRPKTETNFTSILNNTIVNSDKILGQMIVNQSIGMFSLYPNTDDILSTRHLNSRIRVNSNALNRFPIIQIANLNSNSSIFKDSNLEITNIKENSFRRSNITLKSGITSETYSNISNWNALLGENVREELTYEERLSISGRGLRSGRRRQSNVIKINTVESLNPFTGRGIHEVFETLYYDTDSSPSRIHPTFYIYPERYFLDDDLNYADWLSSVREGSLRDYDNNDNLIVNDNRIGNMNKIRSKFIDNFLGGLEDEDRESHQYYVRIKDVFEKDVSRLLFRKYNDLFANSHRANDSSNLNGLEYNFNVMVNDNGDNINYVETLLDSSIVKRKNSRELSNIVNRTLENATSLFSQRVIGENELRQSEDYYFNQLTNEIISNYEFDQGILQGNSSVMKGDIFVFSTSNSFLTNDELRNYSFNLSRSGNHISPTDNSSSIRYIQNAGERITNFDLEAMSRTRPSDYIYNLIGNKSNVKYSDLALSISSSVNTIKRNLDKDSSKIFFKYIEKVKSKLSQNKKYVLLYDDKEETSLDTYEKSKFISEKSTYKNNFSKEFSEVSNTSETYYSLSSIEDKDHIFSSHGYREFLSKIYTKSFVRDNITLLKRVLKDNISTFKRNPYSQKSFLGFDILLATAISNVNNTDINSVKNIMKFLLTNALIEYSGLQDQTIGLGRKLSTEDLTGSSKSNSVNNILYEKAAKVFSKDLLDEVIKTVFSPINIHSQKNYVIRTAFPSSSSEDILNNISASSGLSGVTIAPVSGELKTLTFPLRVRNHGKPNAVYITNSLKNIKKLSSPRSKYKVFLKQLQDLATSISYSHDIFIDSENTGICYFEKGENNIGKVGAGYTFDESKEDKCLDLKISYYNFSNNRNSTTEFYSDEEEELKETLELNPTKLPYESYEEFIPFSYFYLSKIENTFSNKITEICLDLVDVFKVDASNFNNVSDVIDFIDQNEFYLKIMQDILMSYSKIFLDSYENYLTIIIKNNLVINSSSMMSLAVSDIEKIYNDLVTAERGFEKDNIKYTFDNYLNRQNSNEIFTWRSREIQNAIKLLNNSDIATGICHDIIHGYFLNFEDNIKNREQSISKFTENVDFLFGELSKVSNLEPNKEVFTSLLRNEFFQNIVSRETQEVMYYKNLFNETFIKNNMFNTLKEKYEEVNLFNHRKIFYENKYKQAKSSFKLITELVRDDQTDSLDIIRIPIDYDTAKRIGERGIIQIDLLPVNLKYPEIEYEKLTYYYSPVLTNVTSNYYNLTQDNFSNFIGMYDDTQKISERYSVVNKETAIFEISKIINDIAIRDAETSGEISFIVSQTSNSLVRNMMLSNAIKNIGFLTQKHLDENIKNLSFDTNNLINLETYSLLSSLDLEAITKIFDNYKEDNNIFENAIDSYRNIDENNSILENKEFYKKFLVNLDKDISSTDIISSMILNSYYDVFNIAINRKMFRISDSNSEVSLRNSNIQIDNEVDKCFSYYIGTRIL